jgi:hypothetical protein
LPARVALPGDEAAAGEIIDERLVDRRAVELEVSGAASTLPKIT